MFAPVLTRHAATPRRPDARCLLPVLSLSMYTSAHDTVHAFVQIVATPPPRA